jgi:hypothetical protein
MVVELCVLSVDIGKGYVLGWCIAEAVDTCPLCRYCRLAPGKYLARDFEICAVWRLVLAPMADCTLLATVLHPHVFGRPRRIHLFIQPVLLLVHSLLLIEFSTQCDLVLPLSIVSTLSFC